MQASQKAIFPTIPSLQRCTQPNFAKCTCDGLVHLNASVIIHIGRHCNQGLDIRHVCHYSLHQMIKRPSTFSCPHLGLQSPHLSANPISWRQAIRPFVFGVHFHVPVVAMSDVNPSNEGGGTCQISRNGAGRQHAAPFSGLSSSSLSFGHVYMG